MSSKLNYLKRYDKKKRKKGKGEKSNIYIVDDDINWPSTAAGDEFRMDNADSDEAPLVAEVHDESVIKWQPLSSFEKSSDIDLSRTTGNITDISPPRRVQQDSSPPIRADGDMSPPRKQKLNSKKYKGGFQERKLFCQKVDMSGKFAETVYRRKAEEKDMIDHGTRENDDEEFKTWGRGYVCFMCSKLSGGGEMELEVSVPRAYIKHASYFKAK